MEKTEGIKARVEEKLLRIVKWDGPPPRPGEDVEPAEIVARVDGHEPKVVYRKGDKSAGRGDYRRHMRPYEPGMEKEYA